MMKTNTMTGNIKAEKYNDHKYQKGKNKWKD